MKKIYGVIEIKNTGGETVSVFEVKSLSPVAEFPSEGDLNIEFFDSRTESKQLLNQKLARDINVN